MDVQETLAWCDSVITEVDIELMEWQYGLDRMSFAGISVPLVWESNGGQYQVGMARLKHDDTALFEVSYLVIDPEYQHHSINTAPPGSYALGYDPGPPARVIAKPLPYDRAVSHFTMDKEGVMFQNVSLPGRPIPPEIHVPKKQEYYRALRLTDDMLTIRGLDEAIEKYEKRNYVDQNLWPEDEELNSHPFFKNELWKD